ncbi:MAG: hypothetical protein AAGC56_03715 [Pseudomonadota bacterium]
MGTLLDYAAGQIGAAWRLALTANPDAAHADIDGTTDGVFRSLWAVVFAALPFVFIVLAMRRGVEAAGRVDDFPTYAGDAGTVLAVNGAVYLVSWIADILLILGVYKSFRPGGALADTLVAYNWGQVAAHAIQAAPMLAFAFLGPVGGALWLPAAGFVMFFFFRLFRRTMAVPVGVAAMLIGLLLLSSALVQASAPALGAALGPPSADAASS